MQLATAQEPTQSDIDLAVQLRDCLIREGASQPIAIKLAAREVTMKRIGDWHGLHIPTAAEQVGWVIFELALYLVLCAGKVG